MSNYLEMPVSVLRAALCAVSQEQSRPYLNGVYFDPRGWIVATNGHVMFAAREPAISEWAGAGNIFKATELSQAVKGKAPDISLSWENGTAVGAVVTNMQTKTYVPVIDGTFPNWERVIPTVGGQPGDKIAPGHFLPDPVKAIHAMGKALGCVAHIVPSDPTAPHPVVFDHARECFAVIMPARLSIDPARAWAAMARP